MEYCSFKSLPSQAREQIARNLVMVLRLRGLPAASCSWMGGFMSDSARAARIRGRDHPPKKPCPVFAQRRRWVTILILFIHLLIKLLLMGTTIILCLTACRTFEAGVETSKCFSDLSRLGLTLQSPVRCNINKEAQSTDARFPFY